MIEWKNICLCVVKEWKNKAVENGDSHVNNNTYNSTWVNLLGYIPS